MVQIILFPIWWYSRGLLRMLKFVGRQMEVERQQLGIGVWVKNIFVPMYGTRDWGGRLISLFMRLVQIIARSIILVVYSLLLLVLLLLYLILPALIVYQILFHLFGSIL